MAAFEGDLQQFMMIVIVFKWFKLFCPSLPIFVCFFGKQITFGFRDFKIRIWVQFVEKVIVESNDIISDLLLHTSRVMCSLLRVTLLRFTLVLPPSVAFEAEHVLPDRPTLFPLHPGVENHRAVLTLEAMRMEILVQSMDPGGLRLSLFWDNCRFADTAVRRKPLRVILWTIKPVLIIC